MDNKRKADANIAKSVRSVGIRQVAEYAAVSTASVSRALNNPDTVSSVLRERIHNAINEIGYIPDASARALSSRKTKTIGAIVPTLDNAMFAQGLQALQSYLASQDYLLLLATNGYDLDVELKQTRNLVERGIDGLILRGDQRHPALRKLLATREIPFVNIGIYEPQKPYPSVGVDNAAAGRTLARYMTDLGHRKIALVSAHRLNNDRAQARQCGVLAVLEERGCSPADHWHLHIDYHLDEARDAARALLSGDDQPTAIVCGNDVIAYGVIQEAIRLGISVPEQLSVAGFDDLVWSRHLHPGLTTIHMPTDQIWVRAGRYLIDTLNDQQPLKHQNIDFSLVVRDSTAAPLDRNNTDRS